MFQIYLTKKDAIQLYKWTDDRQYMYDYVNGVNVKMNKMPEKYIEIEIKILKTLDEKEYIYSFDDDVMYYFHKFIALNTSDQHNFLSDYLVDTMKDYVYKFLALKIIKFE